MAKKRTKSGRGRGRPRQQFAKRRATTRAGRQTGRDDHGTQELRAKRLIATGSENLAHSDPIAALYGRELISTAQYNAGRDIADLIQVIEQAKYGSVWLRILSAPGGVLNFDPSPQVERAQRILHRLKGLIGEPFPLVFAICSGDWKPLVPVFRAKSKGGEHPLLTVIVDALDLVSQRWSGTRAA